MFFSKLFARIKGIGKSSDYHWSDLQKPKNLGGGDYVRYLKSHPGLRFTREGRQRVEEARRKVAKEARREELSSEMYGSQIGIWAGARGKVPRISKMSWDDSNSDVFEGLVFNRLISGALDQKTFIDMMEKPAEGKFEDTEFFKMCSDIMGSNKEFKARGFLRLHQSLLDQMDYFLDKYKIQNWVGKTFEEICKEVNLEELARDVHFLQDYNVMFDDCRSEELKAILNGPYEGTEIASHYKTMGRGMTLCSCFSSIYSVIQEGDLDAAKPLLSINFDFKDSSLIEEINRHDQFKDRRKVCDAENKANSEAKEREIIEEAMRKDADYSYTDYKATPEDKALKEKMNSTMIGEWAKNEGDGGAKLMWKGKTAFKGLHFNRFIDDAIMQKTCLDMMNESEGETFENTDFFKMCADMVSDQEDSKLRGFRKAQKVLLDQMDYFLERYDIGKWHGMMIIDIYKNVESKYGLMQYIRDLKFIQNYNQMFENCDEDLRNKLNYEDKGIIEHYNKFCQISDPCATLKSAKALLSSVSVDAQEGVKDSIDLLKLKNKFDLGKGNFSSREVLEALANHDRIKKLRASYDKAIGI